MGEKKINFWKIIKGIKRQSIRMQQRLIVYWCVVILTLFLVTVLLLSILGVLPGMDFKVREMLSAQQKNTLSTMTEQTDIMMARSISLSEDITKELNQCLTANGKTFSDLNDNPQLIMDLEAALYPSLKSALDVKYCSGVFAKDGTDAMDPALYLTEEENAVIGEWAAESVEELLGDGPQTSMEGVDNINDALRLDFKSDRNVTVIYKGEEIGTFPWSVALGYCSIESENPSLTVMINDDGTLKVDYSDDDDYYTFHCVKSDSE